MQMLRWRVKKISRPVVAFETGFPLCVDELVVVQHLDDGATTAAVTLRRLSSCRFGDVVGQHQI